MEIRAFEGMGQPEFVAAVAQLAKPLGSGAKYVVLEGGFSAVLEGAGGSGCDYPKAEAERKRLGLLSGHKTDKGA